MKTLELFGLTVMLPHDSADRFLSTYDELVSLFPQRKQVIDQFFFSFLVDYVQFRESMKKPAMDA